MAVQTEIGTENILNAVLQMPDVEFNRFIENARKLRKKFKSPTTAEREAELLMKINTVFENFSHQRYDELNTKFIAETLSDSEYQELLEMINDRDMLNAQRLEYIGLLSVIRGKSLLAVMQDLGIKAPQK